MIEDVKVKKIKAGSIITADLNLLKFLTEVKNS